MGRVTRSVTIVAGLLAFAGGTARADLREVGRSVEKARVPATRSGLLEFNQTKFGLPSARATKGANGACETGGALGAKVELSACIGATTDVGGLVQCNASVETNLVSVSALCKTAVGSIVPSVRNSRSSAGCSCARGCTPELLWAKSGIEFATAGVGRCALVGAVGAPDSRHVAATRKVV